MEKINEIPLIDTWLIKHQHYLYTKSVGSETSIHNTQLNHQYKSLPSLMPIVNVDQLKTIKLNTWL